MTDWQRYRSKFHHFILIDNEIRSGSYPNSESLATQLEISSRTVRRNIEFMRDVLDAPLQYDALRRGYFYTENNWLLPGIKLTEGDLLGLALAQMALGAYRGTPLESYVRKIADKLRANLPGEIEIDAAAFGGIFQFSLGPQSAFKPEHWETLATAAHKKQTVWMRYESPWHKEQTEREIDPYLLQCYRGDWYIIGYDHLRKAMRMFSVGRIKELLLTRKEFEVRDDFHPQEFFRDSFRVMQQPEKHRVRVQFFEVAASVVAEKQWHPSQKITAKRDGSIVLEMTVSDLNEVAWWVLGFGPWAKVLEPEELRKKVANAIEEMGSLY